MEQIARRLRAIHSNSMNGTSIALLLIAAGHVAFAFVDRDQQQRVIASEHLAAHFQQQAPGTTERLFVQLTQGTSGLLMHLPVVLLKGAKPGPRLAVTAGIHGDEVTGVAIVVHFLEQIDLEQLHGEILAIPVLNPFGFARYQRRGFAGVDINRSFKDGYLAGEEVYYAEKLKQMFASCDLEYHVDLHTATTGFDNSFYVRADLSKQIVNGMSRAMLPQIILNTTRPEDSLRHAMTSQGVYAITVEAGGSSKVNNELVSKGVESLSNMLRHLEMIDDSLLENGFRPEPLVCSFSKWICTDVAGLLYQKVEPLDSVKEGDVVAEIKDLFGKSVFNITAPFDGVIIGKSERFPVEFGARIARIGKVEIPNELPFFT